MSFVLYAPIASKSCGKPICFDSMTGIGPMTSPDPDEWQVFSSEEAAQASPALRHPLAVFHIRPLGEVA